MDEVRCPDCNELPCGLLEVVVMQIELDSPVDPVAYPNVEESVSECDRTLWAKGSLLRRDGRLVFLCVNCGEFEYTLGDNSNG